jgi:hypothetical protein
MSEQKIACRVAMTTPFHAAHARAGAVIDADDLELVSESDAVLSECGTYRYRLWRHWGDGACGLVTFVMLNPSTADGHIDDPTIRKCVGFARRWGRHGIRVVNLFALRSTDPRGLVTHADPVGPDNDTHLTAVIRQLRAHDEPEHLIVCAWGSCGTAAVKRLVAGRVKALAMDGALGDAPLMCLGRARDGSPRHPLMLAYNTRLEPWRAP